MTQHKTPEQIARQAWQKKIGIASGAWADSVIATTVEAINADRSQYTERISSLENKIKHLEAEIEYLTLGEES